VSDLGPRILVVDDERDSEWVYQLILEGQGYNVDAYFDPIKALSEFKPGYYDLILLDYRMEGLNGLALVQKIRKLDPFVKAILVTAWQPQTIGRELQNWFMKVLPKPISEERLIEEIRVALKQARTKYSHNG
jgi:DNA-binding NtrC family response regulator